MPWNDSRDELLCSTRDIDMPVDHVREVRTVTASAVRSRSDPRSNDGQTILETTLEAFRKTVTCMFGRDGRIRTGGLLLPKQAR